MGRKKSLGFAAASDNVQVNTSSGFINVSLRIIEDIQKSFLAAVAFT